MKLDFWDSSLSSGVDLEFPYAVSIWVVIGPNKSINTMLMVPFFSYHSLLPENTHYLNLEKLKTVSLLLQVLHISLQNTYWWPSPWNLQLYYFKIESFHIIRDEWDVRIRMGLNSKMDTLIKRQTFGDKDNVENTASPVANWKYNLTSFYHSCSGFCIYWLVKLRKHFYNYCLRRQRGQRCSPFNLFPFKWIWNHTSWRLHYIFLEKMSWLLAQGRLDALLMVQ